MKSDTPSIDLVYLWVDGNDPKWQAKRNSFLEEKWKNSSSNFNGRYVNNDELKFSLRSVERYAPWFRKIFIVTDDQTPEWLDIENLKLKLLTIKKFYHMKVCHVLMQVNRAFFA